MDFDPNGDKLHRVAIYRDNADKTRDILPYTSVGSSGSEDPENLWKALAAYDAKRFGITMGEEVPMTSQERVYTSPIWYIP